MEAEKRVETKKVSALLLIFITLVLVLVAYLIHPYLIAVAICVFIIYFFIENLERQTMQRRRILNDAMERLEVQEAIADPGDEPTNQVREFPTVCPECSNPLHVKNVTWIDPETLVCKICGLTVKAM